MVRSDAQALIFQTGDRSFSLARHAVCQPDAGIARLSMVRSGICGTDLHIADGFLPFPAGEWILGHEFVGRVEALGPGATVDGLGQALRPGDLAIACVALPCGHCFSCRRGETASCLEFGVTYLRPPREAPHFFGGFAEILFSPAANLVRVPTGLSCDSVGAFPCGGPTVLRACTYAGGLERGELVVVQGTGSLGLFAVAWAVAEGCRVLAIGSGSNPQRTALALRLGAGEVLDFRQVPLAERQQRVQAAAAELGRGDGADVVIETSGAPEAVPEGLGLLRTRGRYLIPGQYSARGSVAIEPQLLTFKALRLVGSGQYTLQDVRAYLDFLVAHPELAAVCADSVSTYRLADWETAFAAARAGRHIKTAFGQ